MLRSPVQETTYSFHFLECWIRLTRGTFFNVKLRGNYSGSAFVWGALVNVKFWGPRAKQTQSSHACCSDNTSILMYQYTNSFFSGGGGGVGGGGAGGQIKEGPILRLRPNNPSLRRPGQPEAPYQSLCNPTSNLPTKAEQRRQPPK